MKCQINQIPLKLSNKIKQKRSFLGSGGIVFYFSYKVWQDSSVLDFQNGKATVVGDVKSINPSFDQLSDLL
jgi:hypothetical protein